MELKPCPFCGSDNVEAGEVMSYSPVRYWMQVTCEECLTSGPEFPYDSECDGEHVALDSAKRHWNSRASVTADPRVAELEAENAKMAGLLVTVLNGYRHGQIKGGTLINRAAGTMKSVEQTILDTMGWKLVDETPAKDDRQGSLVLAGSAAQTAKPDRYDEAVDLVRREKKCSTSFVQFHLKTGYAEAAALVDLLQERSVVSAPNHVGKREVYRAQTATEPKESSPCASHQ